jgi:hypothetical protein
LSVTHRPPGGAVLFPTARLVVLVAALTGCGPQVPSPSPASSSDASPIGVPTSQTPPDLGPAPTSTVADSHASLLATLDAPALAPGGRINATVVVSNIGSVPLHYPGSRDAACSYAGDFWFDFPTAAIDMGRQDWFGDQKLLKDMLFDPYPGSLPLGRRGDIGCDATGPPNVLQPGTSVQVSQAWDGRYLDGYPASAGRYELNVRFVLFLPPEDAFEPLTTTLPIVVLAAQAPIPPGRALDRALADATVVRWLATHPVATWQTRPSFTFRPDTADFELVLEGPQGALLTVNIAADGEGPVAATASTDPNFEAGPSSSPRQ